MTAVRKQTAAEGLAEALAGAWRTEPPPYGGAEAQLRRVAPLLLGSGAGALGWWRLRRTPHLRECGAAHELREAYRLHTLQAALHERDIERVFGMLEAEGIEAMLVKGLAAARFYPEAGLRPFSDIDLCVRPSQFAAAERVLHSPEGLKYFVDLHRGFDDLGARDAEEVFARAEVLQVGGASVRVLPAEEHLRLVSVHLLRHGAWRPVWLCDVGATVESRPRGFDWARALGPDRRRARWVACAVGLAGRLLGARIDDTPLAGAARRLPRWLVPAVLRQWAQPYAHAQAPMRHRAPMSVYLRRPRGAVGDLVNRWPGPLEATIRMGGALNELPRLPYQLGYALARAARFAARLPEARRVPGIFE